MTGGELGSLESALAEVSSLKEALSTATAETEAVRTKLHNAVRKGKTIDLERKKAVSDVDELKQQLAAAGIELKELLGENQTQLALQEQNADLSRQLQASSARTAALDERLKQVEAESMETVQAMERKHHAAEEALQQQIANMQSALSEQVLPRQEQYKAHQEAHARAEEAERQVAELREEAEVTNEALQVPQVTIAPFFPVGYRNRLLLRLLSANTDNVLACALAIKCVVTSFGCPQAAAERIKATAAAEAAAHAEAEARSNESASLRRQLAELEGRLSTADDAQVDCFPAGESLGITSSSLQHPSVGQQLPLILAWASS